MRTSYRLTCLIGLLWLIGCSGTPGTEGGDSTRVAPVITANPSPQAVTVGMTATFTVTVTGTAPITYEWQKNGANIAGATSATYTTPATVQADNGSTFDVV